MKHHYIVLLSYYDKAAGKKFSRNFTSHGTKAQVEKKIKKQQDYYTGLSSVTDLKIDLLRVDTMTHIKTYR